MTYMLISLYGIFVIALQYSESVSNMQYAHTLDILRSTIAAFRLVCLQKALGFWALIVRG